MPPTSRSAGHTPSGHPSSGASQDEQGSWFGGLDLPDTVAWTGQSPPETAFSHSTLVLSDSEDAASDEAQVRQQPSLQRIYRAFLTARAVLAIVLLGLMAGSWLLVGVRPSLWIMLMAMGYAFATLVLWGWPSPQPDTRHQQQQKNKTTLIRQTIGCVGVDLTFFALLHQLTGHTVNSHALLVLPVLMAAVLLPRIMALGVAAAATLVLLSSAWLQSVDGVGATTLMAQAGLTGFGLFAIAILANELATRLAREERSARGSLEMARQQAQLNRLVIEEMTEGVMVVDRKGRVRTANPAARRLLSAQGVTPAAPFQLKGVPAWSALVRAVERALRHPHQAEDGQEIKLRFDDHSVRDLRLRVRFTRGRNERRLEDMCVMLLEDLRVVRARQRQDKLAAMGRMSAGIAHEIRNPLAAIAQANALLAEDAATPTQKKLTQLVTDNVARLKHIIDDILTVAPGVRPPAPAIAPAETVVSICNEWRVTHGLRSGDESLLHIDISGYKSAPRASHIKVRFEPDHLQRVLVNLLDNALRYNTGTPGAITVTLTWLPSHATAGMLMLSVSNDGEPVSADTERALFEPFFSTRSRGTGLGLYISRELCERHGASIDYRQHPSPVRHRNEFFITMPVEPAGSSPYAA
jgi:two-component system sensor histidine kinase PilS (NtrC family)